MAPGIAPDAAGPLASDPLDVTAIGAPVRRERVANQVKIGDARVADHVYFVAARVGYSVLGERDP